MRIFIYATEAGQVTFYLGSFSTCRSPVGKGKVGVKLGKLCGMFRDTMEANYRGSSHPPGGNSLEMT